MEYGLWMNGAVGDVQMDDLLESVFFPSVCFFLGMFVCFVLRWRELPPPRYVAARGP